MKREIKGSAAAGPTVSTLAGSGTKGYADGSGTEAQFDGPSGVAVDSAGNVYVASFNHRIRKVSPSGDVSTLAGSDAWGEVDGSGVRARLVVPSGVAVDSTGNVYVADSDNHRIRKITIGE
jgi:sugar lactone lactonase YvrE